jgi:hypothetical protein
MNVLMIFLTTILSLFGFVECRSEIARTGGMANTRIAVVGDVWALFQNVGGLSCMSKVQTGISYTPGLFNINELSTACAVMGLPTPVGCFGCAARKYGCRLYNELTLGAAFASNLSDFHFGIVCWYHNINIAGYGSAGTIILDAGFLVRLMPELDIGLILGNLSASTVGESKTLLPQKIGSGISYRPLQGFSIATDIEKETMFPPVVRCGIEYVFSNTLALRAGIGSETAHYSGGIGIFVSSLHFDYGVTFHQVLGLTHIFSITIK